MLGLAAAAPLAAVPNIGSAGESFLSPAGPVAQAIGGNFYFILVVMIIVALPLFIGLPIVLWRFRVSDKEESGAARGPYNPHWEHNTPLELLVWGSAALALVVLSVVLWNATQKLDPYKPLPGKNFKVELVTYDWGFLFIYPEEHTATINKMIIPAGEPVAVYQTSDSVMQSVFIPRLAGQTYAMAGMQTQMHFKADAPGTFWGRNTQYNGPGFVDQQFTVEALSADDFKAKMADLKAQPTQLTMDSYDAVVDGKSDVTEFGSVKDGFYNSIFAKYDMDADMEGMNLSGHGMDMSGNVPISSTQQANASDAMSGMAQDKKTAEQ